MRRLLARSWRGRSALLGLAATAAFLLALLLAMGAQAQKHRTQDPEEAQRILKEIMSKRFAHKGVTARGQTIADAPPFKTTERQDKLSWYPCADCHEGEPPNPLVRRLKDEHETLVFEHGNGRFWCYDACHNRNNMNTLVSFRGIPIGYNEAYKLCGQCHFQRQKDWYFGGHGKRAGMFREPREVPATHDEIDESERESIGTWQGERLVHICTDCHDAHAPAIRPYQPSPPPQVRKGLSRAVGREPQEVRIWEEMQGNQGGH